MTHDEEFKLHREMLLWRIFAILLLLIYSSATLISFFIDLRQHASDNKERAAHWQKIEDGVAENNRLINACIKCHVHPVPELAPKVR